MWIGLWLFLAVVADWPALVPSLTASIPRLEAQTPHGKGICSAVVFEIDSDGFAHALTAAHCVDKQPNERLDVTVNDRTGVVVATNSLLDLAIVKYRARNERALPMAASSPAMGAEVVILGYAFGVEAIVAQFGRIAQSYNRETKTLWINADLIFGDSGGGLINEAGELVGINSRIYSGGMTGQMAHIGAAVPIEAVADFIDAYRAERKARTR